MIFLNKIIIFKDLKKVYKMKKNLSLLALLFVNSLFTNSIPTGSKEFLQCNDNFLTFLEKQSKQEEQRNKEQIALLQKSNELQALLLEIELHKLKEKQNQEEQAALAQQIEAEKTWYQKAWDTLAPNIQNAIVRLIIASITGKIINGTISTLDHITGDMLVAHGYDKWALYAGTFIVEESIQGYLKKRVNKATLAHPEVQEYMNTLNELKKQNAVDIAKGEIVQADFEMLKKIKLGQGADEYLRKKAEAHNKSEHFHHWRSFPTEPSDIISRSSNH